MQTGEAQSIIAKAVMNAIVQGKKETLRLLFDEFGLTGGHFDQPEIRQLYEAAFSAYATAAPASRETTLSDVLLRLEAAGASLKLINGVRLAAERVLLEQIGDVRLAARALQGDAIRKAVLSELPRFQRLLNDPLQASGAAAGYADYLLAVAERGGAQESRPDVIMRLHWDKGYTPPVSTGIRRLDSAVSNDIGVGGWERGQMIMIGAPSAHGKSALTCHFACEQVRQNRGVVIHSFEMPREKLIMRMLCNLSCLPMSRVANRKSCTPDELINLDAALKQLGLLCRVYDHHCTIPELAQRIRRHRIEFGEESILHILDHFGKIDLGTDWRDSKSVSARLQELAVREKVCLVMFSQVSPATQTELERDNRTTTAKFFGTSSPYQDADVVMFMCKHNGLLKDGSGYDNDKSYVTCFQVVKVREYSNLQSYFMLRYVPDWYAYGKEVESE